MVRVAGSIAVVIGVLALGAARVDAQMPAPAAAAAAAAGPMKSIREFGVLPENDAAVNKANLQKAIDWAAARGAALYVEPSDEPYRVDGGVVLRMNASLIGPHGPVG